MGPKIYTKRPNELTLKTAAEVDGTYVVPIDKFGNPTVNGILFSEFSITIAGLISYNNLADKPSDQDLLDAIKNVDGNGSGLDADTVRGYTVATSVPAGAVFTDTTYSANDMLTAIKTVDGSGSGLDADLLDGKQSSVSSAANTIPIRNASQWIYAVNFETGSDIRWKKDIKLLKKGTEGLIPKSYRMKIGDDQILYGFIAQEMLKTHPELVHENKEEYLNISMNGIIPLLVNDINKLRKFSLIYQISKLFKRFFK